MAPRKTYPKDYNSTRTARGWGYGSNRMSLLESMRLRAAYRNLGSSPVYAFPNAGFRCVLLSRSPLGRV